LDGREALRRDRERLREAHLGREIHVSLRARAFPAWARAVILGLLGAALLWAAARVGGERGTVLVMAASAATAFALWSVASAVRLGRQRGRAMVIGQSSITLPRYPLWKGQTAQVRYEDVEEVVLVSRGGEMFHALRTRQDLLRLPVELLPRTWSRDELPMRVQLRTMLVRRSPRPSKAELAGLEALALSEGPALCAAVVLRDGEPEVLAVIRDEAHWGSLILLGELPPEHEIVTPGSGLGSLRKVLAEGAMGLVWMPEEGARESEAPRGVDG
jgi:hypothetical protein